MPLERVTSKGQSVSTSMRGILETARCWKVTVNKFNVSKTRLQTLQMLLSKWVLQWIPGKSQVLPCCNMRFHSERKQHKERQTQAHSHVDDNLGESAVLYVVGLNNKVERPLRSCHKHPKSLKNLKEEPTLMLEAGVSLTWVLMSLSVTTRGLQFPVWVVTENITLTVDITSNSSWDLFPSYCIFPSCILGRERISCRTFH